MNKLFQPIYDYFKKLFASKDIASISNEDDFVKNSKEALLNQKNPVANIILFTIVALLLIAIIWAYFATVEQVAIGKGRVVPSSKDKIIQSLDGGIVTEIFVREGEVVQPNQKLIRLDDTRYKSEYSAAFAKYLNLLATVTRLKAEQQGKETLQFPPVLAKHPDITEVESSLFLARKEGFREEIASLQRSYDTALKQTKMYEELLPKGYVSKLEFFRSQQNANDFRTKIIEKQNAFREDINQNLTKSQSELQTLEEQLASLQDKMVRTTLYSPVYGVVKKINIVTVGGVITPGFNIMEIVPLSDQLLIEAYVSPADIAFVHIGQTANVKISAYDFSIYGSLDGTVEYVSASTIAKDKVAQETMPSDADEFYVVKIRVDKNFLGSEKHKLYILPGMIATVYIKTSNKTIMQYLLKPLIKAKEEALREK